MNKKECGRSDNRADCHDGLAKGTVAEIILLRPIGVLAFYIRAGRSLLIGDRRVAGRKSMDVNLGNKRLDEEGEEAKKGQKKAAAQRLGGAALVRPIQR